MWPELVGSVSGWSTPKLMIRCGCRRIRSPTASARPRTSGQRTRHGSVEARSSTTNAARQLSATLRYPRPAVLSKPPMSIVPSSAKITITLPEETLASLRSSAAEAGLPLSTYLAEAPPTTPASRTVWPR